MRPVTPILSLPHNLRPSSPPQTPTNTIPPYFAPNSKISSPRAASPSPSPGHGAGPGGFTFTPPIVPPASLSQPPHNGMYVGNGHLNNHAHAAGVDELSPCSHHASDADLSESESEAEGSDDGYTDSPVQPSATHDASYHDDQFGGARTRDANFTIEELSDFDENDMEGRDDVLHPSVIEYAESEPDGKSRSRSRRLAGDDPQVINDLENLNFRSPDPEPNDSASDSSSSSNLDDDAHQAILARIRAESRRQRMSHSSIGTKRTMSERFEGDSDQSDDREDLRGVQYLGFEEVGSSARRLKRRTAGGSHRLHRGSLIFQDPPPRIDEVVEPPDSEELEVGGEEETLARELPFYEYTSMEVDSPRSPYD